MIGNVGRVIGRLGWPKRAYRTGVGSGSHRRQGRVGTLPDDRDGHLLSAFSLARATPVVGESLPSFALGCWQVPVTISTRAPAPSSQVRFVVLSPLRSSHPWLGSPSRSQAVRTPFGMLSVETAGRLPAWVEVDRRPWPA